MNDISKDKDYQEFLACTEVAFGTGNPLLWYGADIRCAEQAPVVRDAFSGAPGTRQPPVYGICARCKKQAPVVRDAFSGTPCAQIIICC